MATLSELTSRRVFVLLIVVALAVLALIIWPFASALFFAAVLAGMLAPAQRALTRRLKGRPKLSATGLVLSAMLTVVIPLGGMAAFAVKEASEGYRYVANTIRSEGMDGLISRLPDPLEQRLRHAIQRVDLSEMHLPEELGAQASAQGASAAKAVTGAVAATGSLLLQTTLFLIALFFLLLDGARLVAWLEEVSPLKPGQTRELLLEFRGASVAVISSTVATAAAQTVAALVGYLLASVPYTLFFAGVTFFMAMIPAVGAASVCLVAALLLLATGHPVAAGFLAVWGVTVVGLVDNVVKPILVRRGLDLHGGVIFFALLGGIAAFGPVGLLIGPMAVSFFLALLRMYERDYAAKLPPETHAAVVETAPAPVPPAPSSP